ncbi:MAG: gamma-glutamyl-gamma-aminobutyrate hydrolase family protein [Paludibacterium sp.]|uniref:gamma-glutamyl-gamma-aminobutyrate hydrolase family protein n=1 Tax=Paludibacterium sp. TaxID=1917523 RepID=UPI0025EDAF53|nr:gamma-glutamyl-gamma-aminobutyrate hydrolase family protein [Paludibacterium sp.]MBV8047706.1 gamma-glutamyl-gamma-aminobutyrate hydrolase family protein [Paludibacterium sp.]MBV8646720.1 gamma-glutamyl-gamma-aminobutyrate hydrolase family protein [Paludibacterium sp.]
MRQAIIGIPCDNKMIGLLPFHAVGDKYVAAAAGGAGGVPILIPSMGDASHREALLDLVDGVLLPGSPSNIEPHHYQGEPSRPGNPVDPARDATTLPLIPQLIERGIPVLGICRGFQEMNVALGGELFQYVHEEPGYRDHREPEAEDMALKYAPAHLVHFPEGGQFRHWLGLAEYKVNSLHGQGVRRLGPSLRAEALSEDGLVEAFSVPGSKSFAFAVQWHPEWLFAENPVSMALFKAFGEACLARRAQRSR